MTDIGNPIPRGTIDIDEPHDTDAPLVDEALAARQGSPSNGTADTVAALKDEIETLKSRISEGHSQAAARARTAVREHPLSSLLAAMAAGYAFALMLHHGASTPPRRRGW
jgi:hypothetical protein